MRMLCKVKLSEHKYKTPEGYLYCKDAIIARTGKQTYLESEIYEGSTNNDYIEVDRTEEEVFKPETLASFENKPLTIEHPNVSVGPENYKDLSVGHVQNVRRGTYEGQPVMLADIVVNDAEAIRLIESGEMEELSCGYDCDITDGPNPEQINIRGNHVALCEAGRAGIARIIDSKPWGTQSLQDSVSKGTLIQEFGKQGKQYKIDKIIGNVIYAESLETGRIVLFKKDEENIEWATITKSEVKDSWVTYWEPEVGDEVKIKSISLGLFRFKNADEKETLKEYIDKPGVISEITKYDDTNHPFKMLVKFDNGIELECLRHELEPIDPKPIVNDAIEYIPEIGDHVELLRVAEGPLLSRSQELLDNLDERQRKHEYGYVTKIIKTESNRPLTVLFKFDSDGFETEVARNEIGPTNIKLDSEIEYNEKDDKEDLWDLVYVVSEKSQSSIVHAALAKYIHNLPERIETVKEFVDSIDSDFNQLLKIRNLKTKFAIEVAKELKNRGYEIKNIPDDLIEDSIEKQYIIELEDKKSWLDINDKPTLDKSKARRFNSKEEAESHMNTYCKGSICEFVEDTFIEDKLADDMSKEIEDLLKDIKFDKISESWGSLTVDFLDKDELKKAAEILVDKYDIEIFDEDPEELYIAVYDKLIKDSNEWTGFDLYRGNPSKDFKQYLRDRGLYFEPSSNGDYVHFEVKNADEDVHKQVEAIREHWLKFEDSYSQKFYSKMIKQLEDELERLEKNEILDENNFVYEEQKNSMKEILKKQIEEYKAKLK